MGHNGHCWRHETADKSPVWLQCQPQGSNCFIGHSHPVDETVCVHTGFHSAVIHVRTRFWGTHIHNQQPHLVHLCLLCGLGKINPQWWVSLLKTLQIHSKLRLTESKCPPASTIFIISLAKHGPYWRIHSRLESQSLFTSKGSFSSESPPQITDFFSQGWDEWLESTIFFHF